MQSTNNKLVGERRSIVLNLPLQLEFSGWAMGDQSDRATASPPAPLHTARS
jgi:hypothetical protein